MTARRVRRRTPTLALISDIHANLPALEAVLRDVDGHHVDQVYCLGDIVGYGAWPNEVVALLRRRRIPCIVGNVDLDALSFEQRRRKLRKRRHPDKFRSLEVTSALLSPATRRFLEALPARRVLAVGERRIVLVHGSPAGPREPILPDATPEQLAAHLDGLGAAVLACGHTHLPFSKAIGPRLVVNAGTVGRPGDGDPRACYAILKLGTRPVARIVRVAYDVERAVAAAEAARLPIALRELYRSGINPWLPESLAARQGQPPDDPHLASLATTGAALQEALDRGLADDPEGIHDVRVATRRLRAGLALLAPRVDIGRARKPARRARRMLADLGRALSEPRSLQVRLGLLEDLGSRISEGDRLYLESVVLDRRVALAAARDRARSSMQEFDRARFSELLDRAVVQAASALGPLPEEPAAEVMPDVHEALRRAEESRSEADLHELRIALKKLRYTLEAADRSKSPWRAAARVAQDVLGEVHDRDEILRELRQEEARLTSLGSLRVRAACARLVEIVARDREAELARLDLGAFAAGAVAPPAVEGAPVSA